jgi:choline kinase
MGNNLDYSEYHVLIPAAGKSSRMAHLTRDKPKAFLEIFGKSIIEYNLDILNDLGFRKVTFVTGYNGHLFKEFFENKYKGIEIDYIHSDNWHKTEHGFSLFLTRKSWIKNKCKVILIDSDSFFDKSILKNLLFSEKENLIMVDSNPSKKNTKEELIFGRGGNVEGFRRGIYSSSNNSVGEFVGICKFSKEFMEQTYAYMEELFSKGDFSFKYEKIFDDLLNLKNIKLNYLDVKNNFWINMNSEEEYLLAKKWVLEK